MVNTGSIQKSWKLRHYKPNLRVNTGLEGLRPLTQHILHVWMSLKQSTPQQIKDTSLVQSIAASLVLQPAMMVGRDTPTMNVITAEV